MTWDGVKRGASQTLIISAYRFQRVKIMAKGGLPLSAFQKMTVTGFNV
jgi:hypothetical protein